MKYYSCPICNNNSSADQWNNKTLGIYGDDIGLIESEEKDGCFYVCPVCEHEEDGSNISFKYESE